MLITILDLETTSLSPADGEVIEVGAILYSVEHRAILQQVSTLLPVASNGAEDVNGIGVELVGLVPSRARKMAFELVGELMAESTYLVAFNSDFDRQWFPGWDKWSDAAAIRYPRPSNSRSLVNLCLAHGIPVVSAHRALDDCRLLAELLGKVPDLEAELARAARPKVLVRALVGYEGKDAAKAAGFYWDREVPRAWAKRMPWEDAEELQFEVMEVVAETARDRFDLARAEAEMGDR